MCFTFFIYKKHIIPINISLYKLSTFLKKLIFDFGIDQFIFFLKNFKSHFYRAKKKFIFFKNLKIIILKNSLYLSSKISFSYFKNLESNI